MSREPITIQECVNGWVVHKHGGQNELEHLCVFESIETLNAYIELWAKSKPNKKKTDEIQVPETDPRNRDLSD